MKLALPLPRAQLGTSDELAAHAGPLRLRNAHGDCIKLALGILL